MDDDRNPGVTEARFVLTLVITGLVAVGFVVLQWITPAGMRLGGGPSTSTIEISPNILVQPTTPREDDSVPRVLPVDVPDGNGSRPREVATKPGLPAGEGLKPGPDAATSPTDAQRR